MRIMSRVIPKNHVWCSGKFILLAINRFQIQVLLRGSTCCIMFFSFFVLLQPYLIIILSSATGPGAWLSSSLLLAPLPLRHASLPCAGMELGQAPCSLLPAVHASVAAMDSGWRTSRRRRSLGGDMQAC